MFLLSRGPRERRRFRRASPADGISTIPRPSSQASARAAKGSLPPLRDLYPNGVAANGLDVVRTRAPQATNHKVSDGTRTRDRLDHNQELYQLSYAHQA